MQVQEQLTPEVISREDALPPIPFVAGERVALLTGGIDRPYAFGLATALGSRHVPLDVIGNSDLDCPELRQCPSTRLLTLHVDIRKHRGKLRRLLLHLLVYTRLFRYSLASEARIFHILWNYKFEILDRTLLMVIFRLFGKRIVLTAHNVNTAARDHKDSLVNRITLGFQYRHCDRIFVHTEAMRDELISTFGINPKVVVTIPFGVNNSVPTTTLTSAEAKQRLGLAPSHKAILFFGRIRPYKGLHYLVHAFIELAAEDPDFRLIIAGEPKKDAILYWKDICQQIAASGLEKKVISEARFIREEETELYFKAADVVVLPYTAVFQSGVLFLAYSFGLPVIASDVGSLRADILNGETGYVFRPEDVKDLAQKIHMYFQADLYKLLTSRKNDIRSFVTTRNSWKPVTDTTLKSYNDLIVRI